MFQMVVKMNLALAMSPGDSARLSSNPLLCKSKQADTRLCYEFYAKRKDHFEHSESEENVEMNLKCTGANVRK